MSAQKFIESIPSSITKHQGFAIGRHLRALKDPEIRRHPLLVLGYQHQRKVLKFQPIRREPWSSWEHGFHININALCKILTPQAKPENITVSNLLFNTATDIKHVRGQRRFHIAKDKIRERSLEFRASESEKMKENWPYVSKLINLVQPKFIYLHSHPGYLALRDAQPEIFRQRLTTLSLGYDAIGRTLSEIFLDVVQIPEMDRPCVLITGPDFMVMTYKSDSRLNQMIYPIKTSTIQRLSALAADLSPRIQNIEDIVSVVNTFNELQDSKHQDNTIAVEGFSSYAYTKI